MGNKFKVSEGLRVQSTDVIDSSGNFVGQRLTPTSTQSSTSTQTGALVVPGGAGIGGDAWVGGDLYANGRKVITTATVNQFANQTAIFAGTDTAVSTSTGNITIWNTSTFQSVTDRGNVTTNSIRIDNTSSSTSSFSSNALYVAGGIGGNSGFNINGDSYLQGNLNVTGYITGTNVTLNVLSASSATFYGDETGSGALYAGVIGHTPFAQTMIQATGDYNGYMEINVQNINAGNHASTDIIASADNVSETGGFIDMGITGSGWDGTQPDSFADNLGPNDGYLLVGNGTLPTAGHLVIGTISTQSSIKIVVAGTNSNYVTAIFNTATTQSISTTTGALVVRGGVGVGGGLFVGGVATATSFVGNLTGTATTATNIAGGLAGSIPYQTVAGTTAFIGIGTNGYLLQSNGSSATWVSTSSIGVIGYTGSTGTQGIIGYTGSTGTQGIIGYTGSTGTQGIIGYTGSTGTQGVIGYTGSTGTQGIIGYTGSTGTIGYTGSTGTQGIIGYTGSTGTQGIIGYTGSTGTQGVIGYTGSTGTQGVIGYTGSTGLIDNPYAGILTITNTTTVSSTVTGALQVAGGVGVGGSIFVGGTATVLSTLASTTTLFGNALYVAGGVGIAKSLLVTGEAIFQNNVTFSGTTTFVFSTNTVYTDNILNLHTPSGGVGDTWTVNDGKDIGFVFHNYIDGADNDSFLGFANDTKYLEWYVKGSESTSSVFTGTVYGIFKTGGIVLVNTTASNSTNTGALTVAGGVGIGGSLYVGGVITATTFLGSVTGTATTATNITGGTLGQIPYQSAPGVTRFINTGVNGALLQMGAAGTATFVSNSLITVENSRYLVSQGGQGSIPYSGNNIGDPSIWLSLGSNGYILVSDTTGDGQPSWANPSTLTVGSATTATAAATAYALANTGTTYVGNAVTATNIRGGSAGSIPYQTVAGTTAFIGIGTNGYLLQSNGSSATWVSTSSIGVIGYTGSTGTQGIIGYTGSTGTQGIIGYTGSTGTQGIIGYTGSTGTQGIIGYTGSTGTQGIIGYTGSTGTIGYTGSTGTQGIIGYTGSTGTQGIIGYTGSTGTQGVIGYTGSTGTQGVIGYTGSTGTQGIIGYTGSTGTQGIIGYTGSTGTQGVIGYTGSTGLIANPYAGILTITNTTTVSSTVTGALQVAGGVGIGGGLFVGGIISANQVTASSIMGINGTNTRYGFSNNFNLTGGATAGAFNVSGTIQSDVTATAYGSLVSMSSQAANFTLDNYRAYQAGIATVGAGNTITNSYGFAVDSSIGSSNQITNAYGFYSGIAGGTGRWNIHSAGTASNYFAGNVGIGTGKSVPGYALDVNGIITATNITVANTLTLAGALSAGGTTGTNGQVLISTGGGVSWTTLSSSFNGGTITSPLIINNSTGASSTTTGALQIVNGGAGIGGGLVVGGISTVTNTTAASSTNTGALQVRGGIGVGGNLYAELDGYFNGTRVGRGAGNISSNTVLGNGALDTNTTGTNNIAIGYLSLNSNQTGANNVALGYETMFGTTDAFADTALGARALQNISSGQYNIGIGYNAGNSITTGNGNTIIGSVSGTSGLSDTVIIAAGTTERIRVDSSNLYINGTIFTGGAGAGGLTQGQAVAISMGLAMP